MSACAIQSSADASHERVEESSLISGYCGLLVAGCWLLLVAGAHGDDEIASGGEGAGVHAGLAGLLRERLAGAQFDLDAVGAFRYLNRVTAVGRGRGVVPRAGGGLNHRDFPSGHGHRGVGGLDDAGDRAADLVGRAADHRPRMTGGRQRRETHEQSGCKLHGSPRPCESASGAPRHGLGGALPNTSTIVAAAAPVFLKVCFAPPLRFNTWPWVTSTGSSPSTVSSSCPVTSVNTCHVASSCECMRRVAPGSA